MVIDDKLHYSTNTLRITASLQKIIDHDNHDMRANFREYLKRPEFKPKYAISLNEERDLALERLQQVTLCAAYITSSSDSYRDEQMATI